MPRSLLILMLMTTQLLSWSGGSFYLCIASDGSYRIDAGPDSCASCRMTCGTGCNACTEDSPGQHGDFPCGKHGNAGLIQPLIETPADEESCDCTHIPITVSSDQPTRNAQTSVSVDFERLSSLVAQARSIGLACPQAPPSSFHRRDTSIIPAFTLTVVATVIIRC